MLAAVTTPTSLILAMSYLQLGHSCEGVQSEGRQWSSGRRTGHQPQDTQAAAQTQVANASNAACPQPATPLLEKVRFLCVPFSPSAGVTTGGRHLPGSWATQKWSLYCEVAKDQAACKTQHGGCRHAPHLARTWPSCLSC